MKKLDISTTCKWWISSIVCNVNSLAFSGSTQKTRQHLVSTSSRLFTTSQCRHDEKDAKSGSLRQYFKTPYNQDQTLGGVSSPFKLHSTFAPLTTSVNEETTESTTKENVVSAEVEILADHEEFILPERDTRKYRAIKLKNNLQVLIVSDQMSSGVGIEAGSVHVKSGHFDDTVPGLARKLNFCTFLQIHLSQIIVPYHFLIVFHSLSFLLFCKILSKIFMSICYSLVQKNTLRKMIMNHF